MFTTLSTLLPRRGITPLAGVLSLNTTRPDANCTWLGVILSLLWFLTPTVAAAPPPFDPPAKLESPPRVAAVAAVSPTLAAATAVATDGIAIQLVWDTYYADLDLYLFNSQTAEKCYYAHPTTSWGCVYNYDNWGGRQSSDPFPYVEQITVDLDHLLQNSPCTYSFWVNYYNGHYTPPFPTNVPASLDLFWGGELVESFATTLSGRGDWQKIWEGCAGELELLVILYDEAEAQNNDCPDTEGQAGDPINLVSGAQTLEQDLLTVQGALPISFGLQYNSRLLKKRATGRGWEDKYFGASLERLANGDLKVNWSTNRYNVFTRTAEGQFLSPHSACHFDTLVENADGSFTLERKNQQVVYQFNTHGQLIAQGNRYGQFLSFSYDTAGRLSRVTEPVSGVFLNYTYNSDGLLTVVTDSLSRQVTLGYDLRGNLTTITDATGQMTTYTYTNRGQILTGTHADGVPLFSNTYDENHRVIAQTDSLNQTIHLVYELESPSGQRLTTLTNRLGETRHYRFHENNKLLSITNELGHSRAYTYDANGNRTSATDALGRTHAFGYDAEGNLTTLTDAAQHQTQLVYDEHHNLLSATNALGQSIQLAYDEHNRLIQLTDPQGQITRYTYNTQGQVQTQTSPRGGVTTLAYTNGRPTQVTDPEGVIYTLGYDAVGRLITLTDVANRTTTLTYDGKSRVIAVTNPLGHSIHLTYDRRDNVLTFTDANGQVTRRQYDGNGNLTRQINALNQETRYEYEGENRLIRVIDAKNQVTQLGYDAKGRLISLTNPLGDTQTLEYDAADNLLKRFDALGKTVISLNYDELNNPTRVTDALANHTFFDYDELSRLTQTTDPLAAGTQFHYDDLNRLIASVDALTGVSSQKFDAEGNRENLIDPNRHPTQFDFDLSGRLVQETVATGNQVKYRYNTSNLLTQITNARGQSRQLEYDAAGRLTRWTDPDGTTSYSYDNNGNILTVTDSQGTITRTYDVLNRVTSYTDVNENTLHYEYDEVGNLVTLTYPDDKQVHYDYDAADQLVKVTDWAGRITPYQYDANGRLIKTLRPNGTVQTRQYDVKGQLLAQTDLDAQGNSLVAYTFSYDAAGNLVQELVTPEVPFVLPPSVEMIYTAANRLATFNGQAVQFDADGNLLTAPLNGQMSSLQFDSRNRLVQAGNTSYRYDAENQRIGVNQTNYVINSQPALSQVLVKEENGVKTFYVYGLGLIGEETNGQYRSYHFDYRGSTVALTDGSGQVIQRFQYAPYGELISGDATQTPFLFNGLYGVMTDESGLYYMRARYYNPAIKRFVNQDVLLGSVGEGQTLNRFAYGIGNPISHIDPEGKWIWWAVGIGVWVTTEIVIPSLSQSEVPFDSGEVISSSFPEIIPITAIAMPITMRFFGKTSEELCQEVTKAAVREAELAQSSKPRPGAAGAIGIDDQIFTASSVKGTQVPSHHSKVQQVLDEIPENLRSSSHGRCVEPQCLSQIIEAGLNPQGGVSVVVKVRAPGNPQHGSPLPACSTCEILLKTFGIKDGAKP